MNRIVTRPRQKAIGLLVCISVATLAIVIGSQVASHRQWHRDQQLAIAAIERLGGTVSYESNRTRLWLFGVEAVSVDLNGTPATDDDVDLLQYCTRLNNINLVDTQVSLAGIETLRRNFPTACVLGLPKDASQQ